MKQIASWFGAMLLALDVPAFALNVFACGPEWAALAQELGGDKVTTYSATSALQDPHRIEAKPSLIAKARRADLVICTGADLEAGWLPVVLQSAANRKVQPGQPGYFEAAQFAEMIGAPARLDRADGDVHAAGNPHLHLDPRNMLRVAQALAQRMAQLDAGNAPLFEQRTAVFTQRWRQAIERWEGEAAGLRGVAVVQHHDFFAYLFNWLGIRTVGTLEAKPGIEPSVSHMAQLAGQQGASAKMVVRNSYNDARASQWFAERAKVPMVVLPATVGGSDEAKDLFGLFDDAVRRLLKGAA